jgi:NAD(P)-dependent dehydrogenase (short-subunit alcohol dehydrogenase family)
MEVHKPWSAEQIPDQSGKVVLITGANSGLGYESALALARAGAQVIMGCRNSEKSETARQQILEQVPGASVALQALDLSSLGSIRGAARQVKSAQSRLDILINNAGVMATPRRTTADGFELQFGTNHLGHFALTGLLLDLLLATPRSRIVTVTSLGEYTGRIRFDDLMREKSYERWTAYGQSKLANLLFAFELQRKLEAAGAETISLAAHPGFSSTNLRQTQLQEAQPIHQRLLFNLFEMPGQSATMGALPQLYAATAPDVQGGDYYGPGGFFQVRGYPKLVKPSGQARDREVARRLWQVSEQLTGVDYAAVLKPT